MQGCHKISHGQRAIVQNDFKRASWRRSLTFVCLRTPALKLPAARAVQSSLALKPCGVVLYAAMLCKAALCVTVPSQINMSCAALLLGVAQQQSRHGPHVFCCDALAAVPYQASCMSYAHVRQERQPF